MDFERLYYNQQGIWDEAAEPYQDKVLKGILDVMPNDIHSILDVGCGNGFVLNALTSTTYKIGVDIAEEALSHLRCAKAVAALPHLPFPDASFDLVMANDVIEHLTPDIYASSLGELQRVARKCLLVSVPFMENLEAAKTFCPVCQTVYHVNHHFRAFGIPQLASLFSRPWSPHIFTFSGADITAAEMTRREVGARLGVLVSWDKALCPVCGTLGSQSLLSPDAQTHIDALANRIPFFQSSLKPNRSECIVIYRRDDPCRSSDPPEAFCLSLSVVDNGQWVSHGGYLAVEDNHVVFVPHEKEGVRLGERCVLQWHAHGLWYRLPEPEIRSSGNLNIPLWFLPQQMLSLVKDNDQQSLAGLDPIVIMAIRAVVEDAEKTEVKLQNAQAELDVLRHRLGQQEQLTIELQNARAALDGLKLRLGQHEQLMIELQNARAELDGLKLRLGQHEQLMIELQNARAELDGLKLRLGQQEQLVIELQKAQAELNQLKRRLGHQE